MAANKTRVAVIQLAGHDKVVRSYIEMRALYEAFAKARKVAGGFKFSGSKSYWEDMRMKTENNERKGLRKTYQNEVERGISEALGKIGTNGISPYVDYMCELHQQTFMYRRQLDGLIAEDLEYARSEEKLFGILGKLAVVTKAGADIALTVLGELPGASSLVGYGYTAATDTISTIASTKDADVFCFVTGDTGKGLLVDAGKTVVEKVVGKESNKFKVVKIGAVIQSIYSAIDSAKKDWQKFD